MGRNTIAADGGSGGKRGVKIGAGSAHLGLGGEVELHLPAELDIGCIDALFKLV